MTHNWKALGIWASAWAVGGGLLLLMLGGASIINNFQYEHVSAPWVSKDPDSTVIFTALESLHIARVSGVVNRPAPGAVGLYVVNDGMPCRNPATNNPNGKALFQNSAFDTNGPAGHVQTMLLNAANNEMVPGQSLCIIDTKQVSPDSRATLTVGLGP